MSANSTTVATVGLLIFVPLLMAAYVFTRWRRGDWSRSRDPLMLAWVATFGALVIALFQGPLVLFSTTLPLILMASGAYLVAVYRESRTQPHWLAGWLAFLAGAGWFLLGAIRFVARF